nr:Chain A, peptide from human prion [synthetic construct]
SNQNNF